MRESEKYPLVPNSAGLENVGDGQQKTYFGLSLRLWLLGASAAIVSGGALATIITVVLLSRGETMCVTPGVNDPVFEKNGCPDDMTDCGNWQVHKVCKVWCELFAKGAIKSVQKFCADLPTPPSPLPPG